MQYRIVTNGKYYKIQNKLDGFLGVIGSWEDMDSDPFCEWCNNFDNIEEANKKMLELQNIDYKYGGEWKPI